jgi:hypothetical protein
MKFGQNNALVISVDLDGVMVDFTGALCKFIGVKKKEFYRAAPSGVYDLYAGLEALGMDGKEVWGRLDNWFWKGIEPTPWAHPLLNSILSIAAGDPNISVRFLTAGSGDERHDLFIKQRTQRQFPDVKFISFNPHKAESKCSNDILIDDSPRNIYEWGEGGILFPTYFNTKLDPRVPPEYAMEWEGLSYIRVLRDLTRKITEWKEARFHSKQWKMLTPEGHPSTCKHCGYTMDQIVNDQDELEWKCKCGGKSDG